MIASYIHKPVKFYDTWMEKASENATLKGHSVLYREKILPPLTQNKNFRNNSTEANAITEEARRKFKEKWNETQVDTAADDTRRGKILEIVKPILTTDPAKPVVDVPEVKTLVGDAKICWGCLSQVCRQRQYVSQRFMGKKLVNRFCPVRKAVLGDRNLTRTL